jgi:tetratricopeptide (TPR) repeat protein
MPSSSPRLFIPVLLALVLLLPCRAWSQADIPEAQRLYNQAKYEDSRRAALESLGGRTAVQAKDVDTYVVLCLDLLALGRYADAENYALKAYPVSRDPRLTEVLGEAAFNLGRNDTALKHFQNYIIAIPEGSRVGSAYYFMGEIYLRMARYAHADIAFTTALQFAPGNARWWARAGWAREKASDLRGGLAAYTAALAIEPRLEDAVLGRERVEAILKD